MRILVEELVKSCNYTLESFLKVLTKNGISNHIELDENDLIKLYNNTKVVSRHSLSLRNCLCELLNSEVQNVSR